MDILAIDIGTVRLKYLRLNRKGNKNTVVAKDYFDYKGTDDDLNDILSVIKSREGTELEVVIGLTSQEVFKKTFTIPIMPKEEIREAINWSASKVISTPMEDILYEYDLIGEIDERGIRKNDIFLAGIEKTYADRILTIFKSAGFKKISLLTDNTFVYAPYLKDISPDLSVVIDMGGRLTGIYIVEGGKIMFVREIMTASESFTDALMSGFGLSYEEAERYKKENGFKEESANILSIPLERLIGEFQRTLSVFTQKYVDKTIKRIYMTGGGSRIPYLIDKIREYFTEEVEYLEPPEGIDEVFLPCYIMCTRKLMLFNLLPPEMKALEKENIYKKWIRIGTVGVFSILVILSLNVWASYRRVESNIIIEKQTLAKKKQQLSELAGVASVSRYNELLPIFNEVQKKDKTFVSLLKYLSSRMPKDIYLKEVYFDRERKADTAPKEPQKPAAQPEAPAKDAAKSQQETRSKLATGSGGIYFITIKGYIFGEANLLDSSLLNLIIKLEESGLIYSVDISGKDIKTLKGTGVMEFEINGRCAVYEI